MKCVGWIIVGMICLSMGCKKEGIPTKEKLDPNGSLNAYRCDQLGLRRSEVICINSFSELQRRIGTKLAIKAAILENGQVMEVGRDVANMAFSAVDTRESNSIFRSRFVAEYEDGGQLVANTQVIWSLGCAIAERGVPPFTSIVSGNTTYLINTSFVWSVPTLAISPYRIIWLVVKKD